MSSRSVSGKEDTEDQLLRQRDENVNLKRQVHDYEMTVKRLQTQIRIKDAAMKKDGSTDKAAELALLIEELETFRKKNRTLTDRLRHLENTVVQKAQAAGRVVDYGRTPQPSKKPISVGVHTPVEIASGKLRHGVRSHSQERKSHSPDSRYGMSSSIHGTPSSVQRPTTAPSSSASAIANKSADTQGLEARVQLAESHLTTLRSENDSLRRQLAEASFRMSSVPVPKPSENTAVNTSILSTSHGPSNTVPVSRNDLLELERQLKDKTAQVLLLKSRYEHLEAKATAERELYDRAVSALEEQNVQIRDARSALQAAEADVSLLRSRLRAQEDTESDLRSARDEVRRLERTLTELCESPFMAESKDRINKAEVLEEAQREAAAAKEQVAHLQHSVRSQHLELTTLRKEKRDALDNYDKLKEELIALRTSCDAAARANATLRERLALYSGMVGMEGNASVATSHNGGNNETHAPTTTNTGIGSAVPPEELERALTLVRKRIDQPGSTDNNSITSTSDDLTTIPLLRRKNQQLQLALLSSQREQERTEAMLKAQTCIASDLSSEVAELNNRLANETTTIRRKLMDTEALAEKRLQRVNMLEAQVKQLMSKLKEVTVVATESRKQNREKAATTTNTLSSNTQATRRSSAFGGFAQTDDDDASTVISALSNEEDNENGGVMSTGIRNPDVNDSVEDSLGASMLDFGPGEDALEIYVIDATLDPAVLGRQDATFAMIDFYNFESQTSPLSMGPAPTYNFSAAYRVVTDHFFLRHVASQGATIDINQARGAEFELIARAVLPLHQLLSPTSSKLKFTALPLVSKAGKVIGSVKVEIRIAVPLGELWEQFNRDQPAEYTRLTNLIKEAEAREQTKAIVSFNNNTTNTNTGTNTTSNNNGANTGTMSNANELLVTVVGASDLQPLNTTNGLVNINGKNPSTYVQYTVPGMAVAVTSVVKDSSNPIFADSRTFPMVPTPRMLSMLSTTPVQFTVFDDSMNNKRTSTAVSSAPVVLGTATVNLASIAEGGNIDSSYDVIDNNGKSMGKLHIRIRWSRPLAAVDGSPMDTLTKAQIQALASVFDRDGNGVKHELLYAAMSMSDTAARAIDHIRNCIATHERSLVVDNNARNLVKWNQALLTAAETLGHTTLSAKEIFDSLTAAKVNLPLDLTTVEQAVKGCIVRDTDYIAVDDIIDIFTPLSPTITTAYNKVRQFIMNLPRSKDAPRLDYALEDEAEDAARKIYGDKPTRQQMARLSRSGMMAAFKYCGMIIIDDITNLRTSTRNPRDANDFNSDPNRSVVNSNTLTETITAANVAIQKSKEPNVLVDDGPIIQPTIMSEIAANQVAIANANADKPIANTTTTTIDNNTNAARRSSSVKELVFDTNTATTTQTVAEPTITAPLPMVDSHSGPRTDADGPCLTIEIGNISRIHNTLLNIIESNNATIKNTLYLTYSIPYQSTNQLLTRIIVLCGTLSTDKKSISFIPYARMTGSGSAFGTTTSFSLSANSELSNYFTTAFMTTASPEDSDIRFILSFVPPTIDNGKYSFPTNTTSSSGIPYTTIIGTGTYNLIDFINETTDTYDTDIPCTVNEEFHKYCNSNNNNIAIGSTISDLHINIQGRTALKALQK